MDQKFLIPFLIAMMLLTGVCNTLLTKYQDLQCVRNCDSKDPEQIRRFSQPVIQTAQMFIGEMGCWLVIALSKLYTLLRSRGDAPLFAYKPINGRTWDDGEEEEDEEHSGNPLEQSVASIDVHAPTLTKPHHAPRELKGWKVVLLALPATCDITGTTLMNVGLLFVAASIYQMTRGALVLFVGLFSVIFLRRRLAAYQWFSLLVVVLGVGIVGLAGVVQKDPQAEPPVEKLPPLGSVGEGEMPVSRVIRGLFVKRGDGEGGLEGLSPVVVTILGVLAIALAQVFTASQFVLEEFILERYTLVPLKVVAWEGTFGFLITVIGMLILHFTVGVTEAGRNGYFDAAEGLREITQNRTIAATSILIMISIGGFNFFGLSITRDVSATARSVIDTCRTLFIWLVSLGLGWESFKWLQILGFAGLVYGTFLFNGIVRAPSTMRCRGKRREEPLLGGE